MLYPWYESQLAESRTATESQMEVAAFTGKVRGGGRRPSDSLIKAAQPSSWLDGLGRSPITTAVTEKIAAIRRGAMRTWWNAAGGRRSRKPGRHIAASQGGALDKEGAVASRVDYR
ncbi:hypothetical protein NL676_004689 [Syzygium grande]|nr:hypothetical protein NL676_004689 [Syzygium grande]